MLTDSQITRLLDIANAGCHKGLVLQARAIYDGVLAVRPGHVPALIGQALSHIVIGEYDEAEKLLCDGILSEHPDDADAKACASASPTKRKKPGPCSVLWSKTVDKTPSWPARFWKTWTPPDAPFF